MPAPVGDRGGIMLCLCLRATELLIFVLGYDILLSRISLFLLLFLLLGQGKDEDRTDCVHCFEMTDPPALDPNMTNGIVAQLVGEAHTRVAGTRSDAIDIYL
ncbi:hypothetical protein IEQ34_022461 [Dendrobium chrysotoxum]|uniref:Uncharacterized protein n=1 Tax=Dendrobium chrysotoxum TaxID=161865 RepID=A0AAV7FXA5_DENCH|nr:hypothetical protein IEQ34_022461 [Dendrobium chrysotoxum]